MTDLTKSISLVSLLTILSRFFGLFRDILFFSCFGVSSVGAAFILAFTLPNLFRRMLGEGTLSSAFIPVYSETEKNNSIQQAHLVLNQVLSRLLVFLLLIALVISLISYYLSSRNEMGLDEKWIDGLRLNSIIFAYVLFICLSAIMVGALNAHGKFFAGAFSPIILNLSMICCLVFFYFFQGWRDFELASALCFSVLFGGILQMILPWFQLAKSFRWRWKLNFLSSSGTEKIKSLFFVGIFGAAVGQINIMISRLLAYTLEDDGALSYLFISARLIELPLGVFAISISTVFFPELSRAFTSQTSKDFKKCFCRGLRLTLAIVIPAAVGLGCLSEMILSVLFQWGHFGSGQVDVGAEILLISSCSLPLYATAAYLVKAFHSTKDMKIPLRGAIISFIVNVIMSVWFMQDYGMYGLAWANVCSAFVQVIYLGFEFKKIEKISFFNRDGLSMLPILLGSLVMFYVLLFFLQGDYFGKSKFSEILGLSVMILLGAVSYGFVLILLKFPEMSHYLKKVMDRGTKEHL